MADGGACLVESLVFKSPAYVYTVPPARTAAGHRAEDWDVNKWIAEVQCKLVTRSDDTAVLRLVTDDEKEELFAACPLPTSGPVAVAVEPVIDSSRYFVLRVEDEASKRHAFLGIGFRSRDAASDLKMALADHERQLQRSAEAERRRDAHDKAAAGGGDPFATPAGEKAGGVPAAALRDLSLKDKITVSVPKLANAKKATGGEPADPFAAPPAARVDTPAMPRVRLAPPPGAAPHAPAAAAAAAVPAPEAGWATF